MTETIEDMEKFVEEREEYFKENVFPITDAIAKAIFDSKKLLGRHPFGSVKCNLVYKGVHISVRGYVDIHKNHTYNMTIKHGLFGFKKVLKYSWYGLHPTAYIFHECEWIEKLSGLVEKIQQEEFDWRKKQNYRKYGKMCKDLSKKECKIE